MKERTAPPTTAPSSAMSGNTAAPAWLEDFQARFTSVIRTPLDRASGTLTATPASYERALVDESLAGQVLSSEERLAVYNRQYWFRLLDVLQAAFPLVCRLLGFWQINEHFARYLEAHPPTGWDIDTIADAFVPFFEETLALDEPDQRQASIEAARIDESFRAIFRAPTVTPFRPSPEDAARLLEARLVESPAFAIVEEHSALCEARRKVLADPSVSRIPFPPKATGPRSVALVRSGESTLEIPLEDLEAALLRLLREHSVRDAMAMLESACPVEERATLPMKTQQWLASAVARGFWTSMRVSYK